MIVVSGPNGAGKSTLAPRLLRDTLGILEYVNADTIALGLSAFAAERVAFDAGRIMLKRLNGLASEEKYFAFETTLAGRFYARWLRDLQAKGYKVTLVFLWLRSVELAVERVRVRVRLDGHDVPEETIRRRYVKGLRNFFGLYQPLADSWAVYDCSDAGAISLIAAGPSAADVQVYEAGLWGEIQQTALRLL